MATFQERLNYALNLRDMKPVDLANKTGLSKARISQYMNGIYTPKSKGTLAIALALNVNETWLMGLDAPMERSPTDDFSKTSFDNIFPIELHKIPLLGEIACGEPVFAEEDRESYVLAGTNVKADFALRCKGDSMIGARILDGDIVFIRKQPMVEDGEIAAVIIDDEATLKRVTYLREQNILILKAENPRYKDLVYQGEQLNFIRILGKAVAFQSDVK